MARRRHRRSISGCHRLGVVLVGVVVLKLANSTAIPLLAGVAVLVVLLVLFAALNGDGAGKTSRKPQLEDLDRLGGHAFEQAVADVMAGLGYRTKVTPGSGDMGVDVIACRGSRRIAVQVKRYSSPVGRRAVADAVAGMAPHRCSEAMVVTNSTFSPAAVHLAQLHGCTLIDRTGLAAWLRQAG
jgi:restriction system protein